MELITQDTEKTGKETRFYGINSFCECDSAIGKLLLWQNGKPKSLYESAILYLPEQISHTQVAELISKGSPVGIIAFASSMSSKLLCLLICSKIPYLILKDASYLLSLHEGRICILDTEKNTLIINPSIKTLDLYPCKLPSALATEDKDPFLSVMKSKSGYLISPPPSHDQLIKIAEKNCTVPITVELPVAKGGALDEFCDSAEAIFCASLYGNLSLMLTGGKTDNDVYRSQKLLHRVFCDLESLGREFNGYIKKGILTAAPSYFLLPHSHRTPDFICIDFDTFVKNMFSRELHEISPDENTKSSMERIWKTLVSSSPRLPPLCIKASKLRESPLLEYFAQISEISEIYIPSKEKP